MRSTSLAAYKSIGRVINTRQKEVLLALEEIYPACNRMVSEKSHLPINVVTPRMGELVSMGKVEEVYKDVDPKTGRRAIFWRPAMVNQLEFGDVA